MLLMMILSQIFFNENKCMTVDSKMEIKNVNIELLQLKILTNDNEIVKSLEKKLC